MKNEEKNEKNSTRAEDVSAQAEKIKAPVQDVAEEEPAESIAAKRLSHLRGQKTDDVIPEAAPKTVSSWLSNFWYHYKWPTLAAFFIAAVLAILIPQCAARVSPDVQILYVGPWEGCYTDTGMNLLDDACLSLLTDQNGDGQKEIAYRMLYLLSDAQAEEMAQNDSEQFANRRNLLNQNRSLLTDELATGETVICLCDPAWFTFLKDGGWLTPLADFVDNVPAAAFDEYGVRLADIDFGTHYRGLRQLPDDTVLCVRQSAALLPNKEETRSHAAAYLTRIFAFEE